MPTLRQLHKITKNIEQKFLTAEARSKLFPQGMSVTIFDRGPKATVNAAQDSLVASIDDFTAAATAHFTIRELIARGNAMTSKTIGKSINSSLNEIALLNTIIGGLEWVEDANAVSSAEVENVMVQLDTLHKKYGTADTYATDRVNVSTVSVAVQESVAAQLKTLRADRDALNDAITGLNIAITIDLPENVSATLTRLNIL